MAAGTVAPVVRVASWNVYWAALDDVHGRSAIVDTIDGAGPLDFMAVIEAEGDTPSGALASWTGKSRSLSAMRSLITISRYESLAIFYDDSKWTPGQVVPGAFDAGRPFLLAEFSLRAQPNTTVWVFGVHLPHFLDTEVDPGTIMAGVLRNASSTRPANVILAGDWNEFQWEDNPCPAPAYPPDCRAQAARRMSALWDLYFAGDARDTVPSHSISCCTKWAPADRGTTSYTEWRFEYDHIFATGGLVGGPAVELPYAYPGVAQPCSDAACTGENPPANVTALYQGSWHRGWKLELSLSPLSR